MAEVTLQIQLRQLPLGVGPVDPWVHQYVALVEINAAGIPRTIGSVHGLATLANGQTVPIALGNNSNLYVYTGLNDVVAGTTQPNQVLASTGPVEQSSAAYLDLASDFWAVAQQAENDLNPLDMRYHFGEQNSNSVARYVVDLFADLFGLGEVDPGPLARRPGWTNGLEDPVTEQEAPRGEPFPENWCFPAGTPIQMADGTEKPIELVRTGDLVLGFDPTIEGGRSQLIPARVQRTFENVTREWLKVTSEGVDGAVEEHFVTPGHLYPPSGCDTPSLADSRFDPTGLNTPNLDLLGQVVTEVHGFAYRSNLSNFHSE